MLRITRTHASAGRVTLQIEGRIRAENVGDVERELLEAGAAGDEVVLDMAGVSYVDGAGARMLRRLRGGSYRMLNCSEFLEQLLGLTSDTDIGSRQAGSRSATGRA